jgi:hypothetical protein
VHINTTENMSTPTPTPSAAAASDGKAKLCENCGEKEALLDCAECNKSFCKQCAQDRHAASKMKAHKLTPVAGMYVCVCVHQDRHQDRIYNHYVYAPVACMYVCVHQDCPHNYFAYAPAVGMYVCVCVCVHQDCPHNYFAYAPVVAGKSMEAMAENQFETLISDVSDKKALQLFMQITRSAKLLFGDFKKEDIALMLTLFTAVTVQVQCMCVYTWECTNIHLPICVCVCVAGRTVCDPQRRAQYFRGNCA